MRLTVASRTSARTLFAIALLAGSACQTVSRHEWDPALHAYARPTQVLLSPGSLIEVQFTDTPELNTLQTILPDGAISLPLLGPFQAAGKSVRVVERELALLYADELRDPRISVVVQSLAGQSVSVGGHVLEPGTVPMPDSITVLEAVVAAGGIDPQSGDSRHVVVLRESDGERRGYVVDLAPAMRGEIAPPFYLQARDVVLVPPTQVAQVNQWIDQYINKMVPQFGFTYSREVGDAARIGIDTSKD